MKSSQYVSRQGKHIIDWQPRGNEMCRFVLYFLSSFVLTASVLARVDGGEDNDIATGGVLKLSTTCKGINVAHARFGNCGYGHFLGYSFGSGKTPGQSPVPPMKILSS